jgi:hypothetical protein
MKLWPISGNLKTMCGEDEANIHDNVRAEIYKKYRILVVKFKKEQCEFSG